MCIFTPPLHVSRAGHACSLGPHCPPPLRRGTCSRVSNTDMPSALSLDVHSRHSALDSLPTVPLLSLTAVSKQPAMAMLLDQLLMALHPKEEAIQDSSSKTTMDNLVALLNTVHLKVNMELLLNKACMAPLLFKLVLVNSK